MNSEPKVLIITYELENNVWGGVGRVINGLATGLRGKCNFDINYLKFNGSDLRWYTNILKIEGKGYKTIIRGELIQALLEAIDSQSYDIVHVSHIGKQTADCVTAIKNYKPEIKIVYSCHNIAKYEFAIRNSSHSEVENEEQIIQNADHLHLLNSVSLNYFKKAFPQSKLLDNFSFIPNGLDEGEFIKTSWLFKRKLINKKKKDIRIICISRWSYGKGLEYLADAVPEVIKQYKNARFFLAGRKKESWENDVDKFVNYIDLKIEPYKENIISLGWLDNTMRNTLFSIADICVMPSDVEYLPYSILEPMINKIPIISSRIDSVEALLDEGKECVFFQPGDSKDLAKKIIYLIENTELRKQIVKNSYDKAKATYRWDKIAQLYADMFNTVHAAVYEQQASI
jgi:glycosyltransferase involved in cell wall biosynthesis